jgi:hypothetical protein
MMSKLSVLALAQVSAKFAEQLTKSGPSLGVCTGLSNAHPLAIAFDSESLTGKWKTVFIDSNMAEQQAECTVSEFLPGLDDSNSLLLKQTELNRMIPLLPEGETGSADEWAGMREFVSGQLLTLVNIKDDAPEAQQSSLPEKMYNQFQYGPTNKFTQLLDLSGLIADDSKQLRGKVIATVTCVQAEMPAPKEFVAEKLKEAKDMVGKEVSAEQLFSPEMLQGRQINLYEVHMKPEALELFKANAELLKSFSNSVSDYLGLQKGQLQMQVPAKDAVAKTVEVDRLVPVNQDSEVCAPLKDL